jgi:Bacterial Ig-like domain (group 3)
LGLGGIAIPTARLTPANVTGTVQFTDGATHLGGPIPVHGGITVGPVTILGKGKHQLTAVFTPSPATKFAPSISNPVTVTF